MTPSVPPASPMSAFSVRKTGTFRITSGRQTITYNSARVDFGGDMNLSTGIFTCPVAGLYYFSFNMWRYLEDPLDVRLQVNGNDEARVLANSNDANEIYSQSLILTLQPGDEVKLVGFGSMHLGSNSHLSNFNGYLIHAIN